MNPYIDIENPDKIPVQGQGSSQNVRAIGPRCKGARFFAADFD